MVTLSFLALEVRLLKLGNPKKNAKIWFFKIEENRASKMAQQVEALVEPVDLSSIPGIHVLEKDTSYSLTFSQMPLTRTHILHIHK